MATPDPDHLQVVATSTLGGGAGVLLFSKLWRALVADRTERSKDLAEQDIIKLLREEIARLSELNERLQVQVQELRDEVNELKEARHGRQGSSSTY